MFSLETAAERDLLFQYFLPEQAGQSVADTTLSAIAQLAALRLNTTRALISLVDCSNQYILVEATQNTPLVPDTSCAHDEHGLLFGRTTMPRSQGLCGHALDILSPEKAGLYQKASRHSPLVINDVALDSHFKDRPFVTNHPTVRFYAAVPINTKSGFTIGTLSVMAEEPRDGITDAENKLLTDLTHAIAVHLELTKANEGHRRSEKMIKGLGTFMQGRADLADWWLELGNTKPRREQEPEEIGVAEKGAAKTPSSVPTPAPLSCDSSGGDARALDPDLSPSPRHQSEPTIGTPPTPRIYVHCPPDAPVISSFHHAPSSGKHDTQSSSGITESGDAAPSASMTSQSATTITPDFQDNLISKRLRSMFSRACHIVQDCLEVDGALFLDASISTLSEHPGEPHAQEPDVQEKTCGVLGFATGENSSMHGEMASTLKPLTESFLQSLFLKYPQGHVFSRDERLKPIYDSIDPSGPSPKDTAKSESTDGLGTDAQHVQSEEEKALLDMLPGTRTMAFIPLWDSHRERWFAGSFMWTVEQTTRLLTHSEDLYYLSAFGNCIMAEVARLDVVGADRAKSDFISSISHELRSPLHGILASVELLQDTTVDLFQHGMIDTIERCGRTLLDTIQHVLDFAKINNFTSFKVQGMANDVPGLPRSAEGMHSLSVDVDLSLLTEDVVDSVFAGHEFQGNSSLVVTDEASGYPPEGLRRNASSNNSTDDTTARLQHSSKKARIDVVMDIGWRPNWIFSTQSGALRRVLMNLFGNALKYTESGWVKVSLHAKDTESSPPQPKRSVITIGVRDSGRGISQDYFHSGLFTPFTQEDSMNSGTGLGLSIVLQIVRSLGGTIDITSEQGVGTEVVVTLTLDQAQPASPLPFHREGDITIDSAREITSGLTVGLIGLEERRGSLGRPAYDHTQIHPEPASFLQASIEGAARNWFDLKIAAPSTFKRSTPDIFITNENPALRRHVGRVPTIVLCSHEALYREYGRRMANGGQGVDQGVVHFVSKPCGPHKLAKAFAYCLSKRPTLEFLPGGLLADLPSPQSLLIKSPEERGFYRMGHITPDDYFRTGLTPAAIAAIIPAPDDIILPEKPKPRLLLVEDNKINLQLLSTFVRKSNYEYHTAENGLLALQAVQSAQTPYDVVFMDISMPVMDGMAASREIRKHERSVGQKACTIIALTGLGSADSQQEAFSSGIDLYLTKPVRLNHLRSILNEWTGALPLGVPLGVPG